MTESVGNVEYVGIGKPEPMESAMEHPAVKAVKGALAGWWERVGPGGVEKSWVNAHKNILANIKETERYAAFERTADTWRKVGKFFGIASTVFDFSLSGLGLVVMGKGLQNPAKLESDVSDINTFLAGKVSPFYAHWYERILVKDTPVLDLGNLTDAQSEHLRNNAFAMVNTLNDIGAYALGVGSAGVALGAGPAHITWSLGAKVAEFFGVAAAKAENYVGTGKLAEHAKAVGGVLDKGVKVAAKNPEIIPEKYRKSVQIIAEASEKEEQARKSAELQRRIQEKANLQREFQTWKDEMDPGEKSYYTLRGEEPPMADFMKEREGFLKGIAQKEAAKKKKV